jgi:hypothetical protein
MTHVPYRGGSLAIQSVMAGDTQLTFGTSPSVLPMASGGRLRAIAVSTRERSPLVPDLPGMKEAGLPDYNLEFWYGMFVPAGTPPAIVKKIYDATVTAMQQPSVKASLAREGTEVSMSASPAEFASFLVEDGKFWVKLVKSANVKVESGERLNEAALALRMGTSRGPIREAIKVLAGLGIVTAVTNRGVYVRQLSLREMLEIYEMRALVFGFAADRACEHFTEEHRKEMQGLLDGMDAACGAEDGTLLLRAQPAVSHVHSGAVQQPARAPSL